jgi:hypothetical protein
MRNRMGSKVSGTRVTKAQSRLVFGVYLKYRRSGGFWPFLDGISKPSAPSM